MTMSLANVSGLIDNSINGKTQYTSGTIQGDSLSVILLSNSLKDQLYYAADNKTFHSKMYFKLQNNA